MVLSDIITYKCPNYFANCPAKKMRVSLQQFSSLMLHHFGCPTNLNSMATIVLPNSIEYYISSAIERFISRLQSLTAVRGICLGGEGEFDEVH